MSEKLKRSHIVLIVAAFAIVTAMVIVAAVFDSGTSMPIALVLVMVSAGFAIYWGTRGSQQSEDEA